MNLILSNRSLDNTTCFIRDNNGWSKCPNNIITTSLRVFTQDLWKDIPDVMSRRSFILDEGEYLILNCNWKDVHSRSYKIFLIVSFYEGEVKTDLFLVELYYEVGLHACAKDKDSISESELEELSKLPASLLSFGMSLNFRRKLQESIHWNETCLYQIPNLF